MAKIIFRHPNDPPKKVHAKKMLRAKKNEKILLVACFLIIIAEAMWIYKLN